MRQGNPVAKSSQGNPGRLESQQPKNQRQPCPHSKLNTTMRLWVRSHSCLLAMLNAPRDACAVLLAGAQLVAQGLCHQSQLLFHQSQLLFPLALGLTLRVHGCHLFPLAATLGD